MDIKPIRNDADLRDAFKRLELIFQAEAGTPEFDEMEVLTTLIEVYENKHPPIKAASPLDAIKFRMEQQALSPKDLEAYIGPSGRVSEILNGKRADDPEPARRAEHSLREFDVHQPGPLRQVRLTVGGGTGCRSTCSSAGSRQAHVGALLVQMFIVGLTDEGSSSAPTRTTVNCGRADELANSDEPQVGQNRRRMVLPLSAVLVYSLVGPSMSRAAVGTMMLTVPFDARCWQSRHQQILVATGSAERRKRTAPQRHFPRRVVICFSSLFR